MRALSFLTSVAFANVALVMSAACNGLLGIEERVEGAFVDGTEPAPDHTAFWLAPWMLAGGRCRARVEAVGGDDVASWKRVMIVIDCG